MNLPLMPDRWQKIFQLVEAGHEVSVDDLSRMLGKSKATIRRDLTSIEERGLIKRTHGGAVPVRQPYLGRTFAESRNLNPQEKEAIGRAAAALVAPGDAIMIDGGYSTFQVARHLKAGNLSIVTNSFDVVHALIANPEVTLVMCGGSIKGGTGTTAGPVTESQILQHVADKAILGADAVSPKEGLTTPNPYTAQTKKAMVQKSRRVIVVADHSKLGRLELHHVAPVEKIATLVTDAKADPAVLDAFRAAGVEILVAPAPGPDPAATVKR